jgi:hypothetical protein
MTAHTAEPGRERLLVPQLGAASSPPHLVKGHLNSLRSDRRRMRSTVACRPGAFAGFTARPGGVPARPADHCGRHRYPDGGMQMRGTDEKDDLGDPARTVVSRMGTSRCGRLIAAVAGGVLVLAGCGPDDTSSQPPSRSGSASAGSSSPSGSSSSGSSSSGSSALPAPADGADLAACADGRCEVRVGASARIPVPRRLRVDSVRVRSVGSGTVTIVGRYLGDRQGGFCTGTSCSSSGSGGGFTLVLGPDSTGSQNDLSITAVAVNGGFAVLRLAPV